MSTRRPNYLSEQDTLAHAMLQSAVIDSPVDGAKARALGALGLAGATTVASAGVAAKAGLAAKGGALAGAGASAIPWGGWAAALACAVGVAAVGTTAGLAMKRHGEAPAVKAYQPADLAPTPAATPSSGTAGIAATPVLPLPPPPGEFASPRADSDTRRAVDRKSVHVPVVAPKAPAASAPPSLALQSRWIDRASTALAGGDATSALTILDAYDSAFPDGALAEEAMSLRIEALVAMGRTTEAKADAARFEERYPASPALHRLHSLLPKPAP